jgi:hypothetical protein
MKNSLGSILIAAFVAFGIMLAPANNAVADAQVASMFFPETGFTTSDSLNIPFLSEFRRMGSTASLGYPISQSFQYNGFIHQAFQRGVLQWRPKTKEAYLANVMDWLSDAKKDGFLDTQGIPRPISDSGTTWAQTVAERESWLTEPAIADAYRRGGGYARYGLPTSKPARSGPFIVQRFQRYSFQYWVADVPGMPPKGSVVGALAGDLVKQAGLIPAYAASPAGPAAAQTNVAVATPAPLAAPIAASPKQSK